MRVFTVSTRRFQRAASRNPGPRNGGAKAKSSELRPSFDTTGARREDRGVEKELREWEQWRDLVDSIEDGKSEPNQSSSSSATGAPTNGPQPRTGPSRSGDWKDGLSPTSLGRVAALEACRDAADSSVEEMSAAMKELQQMQRGAAVSDHRL